VGFPYLKGGCSGCIEERVKIAQHGLAWQIKHPIGNKGNFLFS
jgi:hypothetical protein